MTNVEALKNLYVALGGSAEDVANLDSNAAIINILGNVAGGGGGASGGGLVVNVNISGNVATLDKTFSEIESALMAGRSVVAVVITDERDNVEVITGVNANRNNSTYTVTSSGSTFTTDDPDEYPTTEL